MHKIIKFAKTIVDILKIINFAKALDYPPHPNLPNSNLPNPNLPNPNLPNVILPNLILPNLNSPSPITSNLISPNLNLQNPLEQRTGVLPVSRILIRRILIRRILQIKKLLLRTTRVLGIDFKRHPSDPEHDNKLHPSNTGRH